MKPERYNQLMKKLALILKKEGVSPSVSPTFKAESGISDSVFIQKDMEIESLDKNMLLLVHTLLHKFFATGNRELTKEDIIDLHNGVSTRINHHYFDKLDLVPQDGQNTKIN